MISSKLSIEFHRISDQVREAYISVGMITDAKYEFFMRAVRHAPVISIVTGVHMPTPPIVLQKLKEKTERNELQARVFTKKYFHAKLYVFKLTDRWIAFVGSGNFTDGGWHENEELFITVTDQALCLSLKDRHDDWFTQSKPITERFLAYYTQTYNANRFNTGEIRRNVQQLIDQLSDTFNINNIDFTGQYFSKEDHLAFAPGKTHLDTVPILAERNLVRNRLYELNDELIMVIPGEWDIHPHYMNANIVANIETNHHHQENVRGLWVAYGRSKDDLKVYGDINTTPLHFMRMQVIIQYDSVGIWLMPGKSDAGQIDREFFRTNMEDENYRNSFFELLTGLGNEYWIEIAGISKVATSFTTAEQLKEFTDTDNWRHYYFIIGRDYELGGPALLKSNFINTVLADFSRFIPLYNMMKNNFRVN